MFPFKQALNQGLGQTPTMPFTGGGVPPSLGSQMGPISHLGQMGQSAPGFLSQAGQIAGTAQSASNGLNLMGMFTNVQKAINTAQTVLPMVQKFGPLVKNAPTLFKMMKSFKDFSQVDTEERDEKEIDERTTNKLDHEEIDHKDQDESNHDHAMPKEEQSNISSKERNRKSHQVKKNEDSLTIRPSVPKLYV
ncbi:hypothetical protein GMB86_14260 [Terrilactibacillus sp. BCM23-1]|uniref:YqfQ-like protein n=1 Tax=Terrilactibacillus tamarindi TaxID=2599694 RepID=A0A6N8CSN4_9BACI|nr:VrrA/YqfQ family protein [Terrilactibacillus tamarindi]MTT33164.1 hypothetical protein [Terrilactibacillus tamarindi]